ncbi:hypothetical protein P7G58_03570 [Globicatella sulfidifaciens]|uniref:hypothetical protein n=1 Tax=Globicatella sulfidifaciens TaxID=136093 RepID=UPI00288C960A|nr:hypothetical protein [Globicatella sulfidifaciens]MDT2767943.1 hypothetical protein [Globicatella sulfidifaciens]
MSGLKLHLNVAENKLEKSSQISAYSLKAQWLSGLKLHLNELVINIKNSIKLLLDIYKRSG